MPTNEYEGLVDEDWEEIHDAVQEGFAFLNVPVTFRHHVDDGDEDPLYGEDPEDDNDFEDYAVIKAAPNYDPDQEVLSKWGLQQSCEVLLVIPRQNIIDWEAANNATLTITGSMVVVVQGRTFNVVETATDVFPIGDGSTETYIALAVTGTTKPRA